MRPRQVLKSGMRSALLLVKNFLKNDSTPNHFRATRGKQKGDDTAALADILCRCRNFTCLQTGHTEPKKKERGMSPTSMHCAGDMLASRLLSATTKSDKSDRSREKTHAT